METKTIYLTKRSLGNKLFSYLSQLIEVLTACDYDVLVEKEDTDIYRISYARSSCINGEDWGDDRFMLVTAEEEDMIYDERNRKEDVDENNLFTSEE